MGHPATPKEIYSITTLHLGLIDSSARRSSIACTVSRNGASFYVFRSLSLGEPMLSDRIVALWLILDVVREPGMYDI